MVCEVLLSAGLQELPALADFLVMKCAHPGWSQSGTALAAPPALPGGGVQNSMSPSRRQPGPEPRTQEQVGGRWGTLAGALAFPWLLKSFRGQCPFHPCKQKQGAGCAPVTCACTSPSPPPAFAKKMQSLSSALIHSFIHIFLSFGTSYCTYS